MVDDVDHSTMANLLDTALNAADAMSKSVKDFKEEASHQRLFASEWKRKAERLQRILTETRAELDVQHDIITDQELEDTALRQRLTTMREERDYWTDRTGTILHEKYDVEEHLGIAHARITELEQQLLNTRQAHEQLSSEYEDLENDYEFLFNEFVQNQNI